MHFEYTPELVCSQKISFDLNDNKVTNLSFLGGCNGNLKAIALLLEGKDADYIISTLKGNTCGRRPTSCADQLVCALEKAKEKING